MTKVLPHFLSKPKEKQPMVSAQTAEANKNDSDELKHIFHPIYITFGR